MENTETQKKKLRIYTSDIKTADTSKCILRYIVPFTFDSEGKTGKYNDIVNALKKDSRCQLYDWKDFEDEKNKETIKKDWKYGGTDIFDYLRRLYGNDGITDKNIGSIWKITDSQCYKNERYRFYWPASKDYNGYVFYASIVECGIYLLKTGIGLFWYEVKLTDIRGNEYYPSIFELKVFQNRFKELARTYHNLKWLMTERKNIHKSMTGSKKTFMNWKSTEVNSVMIGKCYEVGNWVNELLNTNVIKYRISYFPDKKLPDKAILYNYIVSKNEKTLTEDSFYLTSGYDNKYIWNEERKNEIEMPFKNEAWYAAKEGSGSYVFSTDLPQNGKKNVYLDYMPRRKKTDYFFMYMHLIQQSYSIMHMSTYIAEHISADGNSEVDYKKLENIDEKINRFLLKNINASVSHIGHHNDYYAYVENRLKIKEDISALKEGVEVLEGILRRRGERTEKERNKGIESILGILTIMGFVSIPETMSKFLNIDMNSGSVVLGAVRWIENTFNCDLTQMSGSNTLYIITGIFIIMFLFRKKLWDIISKIKSTIYEE